MSSNKNTITFTVEALKTKNGLLKVSEMILGAVCLGIIITHWVPVEAFYSYDALYYSVIASLFGTTLLVLSYVLSPVAADTLSNSIYELLHHGFSALLITGCGLAFFIQIMEVHAEHGREGPLVFLAVLGLLNSVLYDLSAYYSYKSFKGE